MSETYVRSTSTSSEPAANWCQWCGDDLQPGDKQHCNAGCLQDHLNDARADARWGEVERLYKLRTRLGWRTIYGRRLKAITGHRVIRRKGERRP